MAGASKPKPGALTEEVAGQLRGKIAHAKIEAKDIAAAVGVSPAQMSKILAGDKQIDIEMLDRICWAIGLTYREVVAKADKVTEFRHTSDDWTTPTLVRH